MKMTRSRCNKRNRPRSSHGITVAEMAGALAFLIPILMFCAVCIYEATMVYVVNGGVDTAARRAARDLAAQYLNDPTIATNAALQAPIFARCTVPNIVNDPGQFTAVFDEAASPGPPTVFVTCVYDPSGLPPGLPNYFTLDPLRINQGGFKIGSAACYRLEM